MMPLDDAITTLRTLEYLARESWPATKAWPHGYDGPRVLEVATPAVDAITLHVEAQAETERAAECRRILTAINGPVARTPTVAPRRRAGKVA